MENSNEIYGVKIVKGINQTIIWKVLKKVCDKRDKEGEKIVKDLYEKFPDVRRFESVGLYRADGGALSV